MPQPLKTFTQTWLALITTAQNIHTLCMLIRSPAIFHPNHDYTANKWLNLDAPIFAHVCMLTNSCHLAIFIKILNVLDLQFQGQIFQSNTLAYAYVKSSVKAAKRLPITTAKCAYRDWEPAAHKHC